MPADTSAKAPTTHIDAALFLGMNSVTEGLRVACKTFFVQRLRARMIMSLEQAGLCDDVIWRYPRELQDAYYPFMDNLHTMLDIDREGYDEADVKEAFGAGVPARLPARERLLLGMVANRGGVLHTTNRRLAARNGPGLRIRVVTSSNGEPEPSFPEPLERLYRESLALRVPEGRL